VSFTYNPNDLTTNLNQLRNLIQDVSSTAPEFQDAEIDFYNDQSSSIYSAAMLASNVLSMKYAQEVDKTVGKLKLAASKKSEHYKDMASEFKLMAEEKGSQQLYAGGISISDKDTVEADTDRVEPDFSKGMFDFEGTVTDSSEN